jgi:hypothetical protein
MTTNLMRAVAAALLLSTTLTAQTTTPERKRLEAMVGTWRIDVDLKATPLSAPTRATGTEECQWFADRHVVCRGEARGSAGSYSQMRTLSYIPAQKQYALYTIDSLGTALIAYGQANGDTWTFTTTQAPLNIRVTLKMAPASYTALAEFAGPDGKYVPLSEVRGTRTK